MLEERVSKALPVNAAFRGALPRDMTFVGQPTITPDRIIARGPSSAMRALSEIRTVPIDISGRRGRVSLETALVCPPRIEIEPRSVIVELAIARRSERTIEGIVPTLLQSEEGYLVEYSPPTAALTVQGPENLVESLVPEDISIILSIPPGSRGTIAVEPEVVVPAGIDSFWLSIASFEVTISTGR
jgi:hypothetical protein